jgi:hypothetical protein
MTTETTREPMIVRPELIANLPEQDRRLAQIILETSVRLEDTDGHFAFERNAVVDAIARLREAIDGERENDTRRATGLAFDLIIGHEPFKDVLAGLADQSLLTEGSMAGAFASFPWPRDIDGIGELATTPLSLIDWAAIINEIRFAVSWRGIDRRGATKEGNDR